VLDLSGRTLRVFPPWYGAEKALASLELFAGEVMPKFRQKTHTQMHA
jgi:hypothetical protein